MPLLGDSVYLRISALPQLSTFIRSSFVQFQRPIAKSVMAEQLEKRTSAKRQCNVETSTAPPAKRTAGFVIGLLQLQALCYALRHFHERTPKRWELVADLVSRSTMHLDGLGHDLILNTQEVGVQFKPDSYISAELQPIYWTMGTQLY